MSIPSNSPPNNTHKTRNQDLALLPAARKRVRLAVQLDGLERKRTKSAAEAAWRRQNARELDIDLSDDDAGEEDGAARWGDGGAAVQEPRRRPHAHTCAGAMRGSGRVDPAEGSGKGSGPSVGCRGCPLALSPWSSAIISSHANKNRLQRPWRRAASGRKRGGRRRGSSAAIPKSKPRQALLRVSVGCWGSWGRSRAAGCSRPGSTWQPGTPPAHGPAAVCGEAWLHPVPQHGPPPPCTRRRR